MKKTSVRGSFSIPNPRPIDIAHHAFTKISLPRHSLPGGINFDTTNIIKRSNPPNSQPRCSSSEEAASVRG